MSYIYRIKKNFDLKVKAKYVWGDEIFESKYKEHIDKNYPIESDYFNTEYYMELGIQTGKYWGDVLFTNGFNILLKKSLYEKMVENGFVNGYKTYKVINTVKGGPEYVGIVVTEKKSFHFSIQSIHTKSSALNPQLSGICGNCCYGRQYRIT